MSLQFNHDELAKRIQEMIAEVVVSEQEAMIRKTVQDFEKSLRLRIAEVAMTISNNYNVMRMGQDLEIRVVLSDKRNTP